MTPASKAAALEAVQRASGRKAALIHLEMQWGLTGVASIASTAVFIGIIGTFVTYAMSFKGVSGPPSQARWLAKLAASSDPLVWTAVGVVVSILAINCYRYLRARVELFDAEMRNASLQLMNDLSRLP